MDVPESSQCRFDENVVETITETLTDGEKDLEKMMMKGTVKKKEEVGEGE